MNKEFEDLLIEFDEMGFEPTTLCENPQEEVKSFRNRLKQALTELQAIKNAKPSEALKSLEEIGNIRGGSFDFNLTLKRQFPNEYETIEQALLKAEKLEKVLEIIKNKCVDIYLLKSVSEVEKYNKLIGLRGMELTQEEFNILKEML